jgi:hypothetical protein
MPQRNGHADREGLAVKFYAHILAVLTTTCHGFPKKLLANAGILHQLSHDLILPNPFHPPFIYPHHLKL